MKRGIKNTILIALLVILIGLVVGTTIYANKNINSSNEIATKDSSHGPGGGGTPPGMSSDNAGTPPAKPDGEPPSGESNGTPPEKPEGESTNEDSNGTPPAKPEDDQSSNSENKTDANEQSKDSTITSENTKPEGEMPSGKPEESNTNTSSKTKLSAPYYAIYISSGIGISLIVIYLIMSGFNKKTFKETFASSDKIIIYVLASTIGAAAISCGTIYLNNNLISNNNSNQTEQKENRGPNGSSGSASYSASKEITEDTEITKGSYSSENADENAISASGDIDVSLSNITVTKTGDSDGGDNSNFYGTNSAIIAKDGASLTIKNATIETKASGANGVFSYGGSATTNNSSSDGTKVTISDSKITTTGNNAGGIMTTGGGTTIAKNLTINTSGTSSAAIRSDRGGGTVEVTGGTYKTTGQGSPAIYSTADITVKDATLTATASEGAVIEGSNSIKLENVTLTDTNNKLNGQSTTYKNIFLYQSASGDAADGNATFTSKNSKIITNKGDSFYITNTTATINLENNTITNNDSTGNFLRAQKDSWGKSGSNGGYVTLNMTNQKATGNIVIDSISTLKMTMKKSSSYTGTINGDNKAKSISLTLSKDSKIKLTGDSYVTSLDDEDTSYSNIDFNGYKLYVNGKAIN